MVDSRWQELVENAQGGPVSQGTMFGAKGLRTGTKFFAIWWHEQLVVKLPPARLTELVEAGEAQPFEPMPGRAMKGWVIVSPSADWHPLIGEARTHVEAQQR
jgi:TfoX/Sxy family transcriptional regulator of competence genes